MRYALSVETQFLISLLKNKYQLLYHRKILCGVEIDLIVVSPQGKIICYEVKANRQGWSVADRVSEKQAQRLYFARAYLETQLQAKVEFYFVLVGVAREEFSLDDYFK